jgi:hypothetical protein
VGPAVDQRAAAIRVGFAGESRSLTVRATNRRGRTVDCIVEVSPVRSAKGEIDGAVLLMKAKEITA